MSEDGNADNEHLANLPEDFICLEYDWGCPNYGDDRSQWCINCQARVTASENRTEGN